MAEPTKPYLLSVYLRNPPLPRTAGGAVSVPHSFAHPKRDVKMALLAWPEIQIEFVPKYASWLNLIEP